MKHENQFKYQGGYCHVLEDRIILSRQFDYENTLPPNSSYSISIWVYVMTLPLIFMTYRFTKYLLEGDEDGIQMGGIMLFAIAFSIIQKIRLDRTIEIPFSRIKEIKIKPSTHLTMRLRFYIKFENKHHRMSKRSIELYSSLITTQKDEKKAQKLMEDLKNQLQV